MARDVLDLTRYLGQPAESAAARLAEAFGELPEATERRGVYVEDYYFNFLASGFSLLLDPTDVVEAVFVYPVVHSRFQPFAPPLPHGVVATTTQTSARAEFGPPVRAGGPSSFLPDAPVTYWDLWTFEGYSLHLQYPESRESICLLTLQNLPDAATERVGAVYPGARANAS